MAALEGVKPGAMDVVNLDEYGRFSAEAAGLPERIVNSQEEIAAIREQRAQAEQQAQELAAAQQIADTANTAAGVVKQLGEVE
ncbi:MAG: hypothetical protein IIC04_12360 [Proteobacteria bacterium]|nr:hypothetical protein [Pseudomonadota bacterium]